MRELTDGILFGVGRVSKSTELHPENSLSLCASTNGVGELNINHKTRRPQKQHRGVLRHTPSQQNQRVLEIMMEDKARYSELTFYFETDVLVSEKASKQLTCVWCAING